jgi:hypothetical protein
MKPAKEVCVDASLAVKVVVPERIGRINSIFAPPAAMTSLAVYSTIVQSTCGDRGRQERGVFPREHMYYCLR